MTLAVARQAHRLETMRPYLFLIRATLFRERLKMYKKYYTSRLLYRNLEVSENRRTPDYLSDQDGLARSTTLLHRFGTP